MKTRINIISKLITLFLILLWLPAEICAAGDILVSFRLYEGIKSKESAEVKPDVVTSYHLRPLFVGNIVSGTDLSREKEELTGIFNLADLKLISRAQWAWQGEDNKSKKLSYLQVIIINGHEFIVGIGLKEKENTFDVEVLEKGEIASKELLGTEIILPETKTAVFGFEDSMKKPYFLSFHRERDASVIREEPVYSVSTEHEGKPKLLKRVSPVYPEVALKMKIEGEVVLEAATDTGGNVKELNVIHGHPLLREAALAAVKQWKYEPYMVSGKVEPSVFTVTVSFNLNTSKKESRYVGSPIDMKLKDAPLEDALLFFAKVSGISIIVDPGIEGLVTCDFTQVPWDEALHLILRLNDLEMTHVKQGIRIRKLDPAAAVRDDQPATQNKYTGELMDFDFKNAYLSAILKLFGKLTQGEITVDPGIEGLISCKMKQVPWDEALDLMLKVNNLYMTRDGNNIRIHKVVRNADKKSASIPNIWPTMGFLSDTFGTRKHPLSGKEECHNGVDIATREGNRVLAAADGVVLLTESREKEGNLITIDHQNGYITWYAKLKSFNVKKGDTVKKGDVIGYVGNTGVSTGPHLHWEVHFNGNPIDPMTVVREE